MSSTRLVNPIDTLQRLKEGDIQAIAATDNLDATVHQWSQAERDALILAISARRPLLVRGETGTGKTQLARATAAQLGWELHSITIHPRIEPADLVYRFDAVKRLADAQSQKAALHEPDYWEPGPLWKAFGWEQARKYGSCRSAPKEPAGHVVLLDEIDKADSDVPNSLLEVLGQRSFDIPQRRIRFGSPERQLPLILITTNEERELPAAFVRRCIVLNLGPVPGLSYCDWLMKRGKAHFDKKVTDEVIKQAAERLAADRSEAERAGLPPAGLAEYIDLLSALHELAPDQPAKQREWMKRLSGYVYIKHRTPEGFSGINQNRPFDAVGGR